MTKFTPCISRNACNEDGTHCRACGRSHEEIHETRALTSQLTDFIKRMEYKNPNEFFSYLQRKVKKKLK